MRLSGNAIFLAGICLSVCVSRIDVLENPSTIVLAAFLYLATTVTLGFVGALLFERSEAVGFALMGLMALGYSPGAGPDAPFFERLPLWLISILALIAGGLAAGAFLKSRIRRRTNVGGD
jgi:hypothetical protein